jgi:hypothetical protein
MDADEPGKIIDLFRIQPDATVHRFQHSIGVYRRASAAKWFCFF